MFVLQTMIFRSKWSPGVVEILPVWNFHESGSYLDVANIGFMNIIS